MIVPRAATPTITFVDNYCAAYRDLFLEVRTFENFKYLHVGMISDIKRKSLPAIARAVGLHDAQPLQNFLTNSPVSGMELRQRRLELTKKMLAVRSFKQGTLMKPEIKRKEIARIMWRDNTSVI